MKIKIIRSLILVVSLFPAMVSLNYLDRECFFYGCSLFSGDNTLNQFGIKVSLYRRCPSSIEFLDIKNDTIGCYFSMISNPNCIPQPYKESILVYYIISEKRLFLCEKDSEGKICYKELKRNEESKVYEEVVEEINIEGLTPRIVFTDVMSINKIIDARDCCLDIVILIILLLTVEIVCIIFDIKKWKKE